MIAMPYTYITPMSFEEASSLIKTWANNELLESMELLLDTYNDFMNEDPDEDAEDDFYETYQYEISAYNKVFADMQPLFA